MAGSCTLSSVFICASLRAGLVTVLLARGGVLALLLATAFASPVLSARKSAGTTVPAESEVLPPDTAAAAPPAAAAPAGDMLAATAPPRGESVEATGLNLWNRSGCAACHVGKDGIEPLKHLAGLSNRYNVYSLAAYLRAPRYPMPPFAFTESDRETLAAYLLRAHP